ncbi:group II truncated hemoglobin [Methyloferula stellata]|uniref:group II truncated hemoglobin n=1 Tax=Methyloferula stellata TaxID=876270 RepID=UPI00037F518A|nr:group II truncated hemoglobin [Methyloferula stellata]
MNISVTPTTTPFVAIGGQAAVDALVDAFYLRMDTLPEARAIRAMHAKDLTSVKKILKNYLGEWMGGPALYSQERGHPRLRMRHMPFRIGEAERDAWMLCMTGALEEVVEDASLRAQLHQSFFKLADWLRNDDGNPHDANHR